MGDRTYFRIFLSDNRLIARCRAQLRENCPTRGEAAIALISALLLILSFPDFDLSFLAWIALAPLLILTVRRRQPLRAFLLGWLAGTLFFFGSCYWLTYSLVHYGGIPAFIAYPLIFLPTLVVGLFPALCLAGVAILSRVWGTHALFMAPVLWAASEWARLGVTGQLWNAVGYSQAYQPSMVQAARWGGVYAVGFLILAVNTALAYLAISRTVQSFVVTVAIFAAVGLALWYSNSPFERSKLNERPSADNTATNNTAPDATDAPDALVIAVQPNVPMESGKSVTQMDELLRRHLSLSESALQQFSVLSAPTNDQKGSSSLLLNKADIPRTPSNNAIPRIVIWPESPMNFSYARDEEFRNMLGRFAWKNHTSVVFNSLEPAPSNGAYNAAVMADERGVVTAQYDKIRLLPFGEYVPLPRWLPGVGLVPVMVGDFTAGVEYPLIPFGIARAGVFICFESAFPSIARTYAKAGADVLVNISNDGYFGPTAVMRQHLANAIFRAVENERPVLRVTNSGITAYITPEGNIIDPTSSFEPAVRTWTVKRATGHKTFYTSHGDLFAWLCTLLSIIVVAGSFLIGRNLRARLL